MSEMKKIMVLTSALFLTGCTTLSLMGQSGDVFCDKKYLFKSEFTPKKPDDFKSRKFSHYKLADDGYIYVLAAALALQPKNDPKKEPHFFPYSRIFRTSR